MSNVTNTTELNEDEYFGEKEIRWYQLAARNMTNDALRAGETRILVVLPTGAGKTITVAATMGGAEIREVLGIKDRNIRVLFVAHKHRLLTQA